MPDTLPGMFRKVLYTLVSVACASGASAQTSSFETVGVRALGMGGAFVAVADDPTAVHWNPAGLPHGGPVGMTFEWDRFQTGNHKAPPYPGPRVDNNSLTSLGTWPIALSYGRFKTTDLAIGPTGALATRSLRVSQVGITLVQTIVQGLVVGGTIKTMRGRPNIGLADGDTAGDALDHGADIEGEAHTTVDFDLGVMVDFEKVRVGVSSKNLREAGFGTIAEIDIGLERRVRLGVSAFPIDGLTFALDVDLDTADLPGGLRRKIAAGGESRLGSRAAMRGGVRWNRDGTADAIASVGGSVAIRPSFWLDGYYTQGRRDEDRGFGFAMRAGF